MTARGSMTIGQVGLDIPLTVPETGSWSGDTCPSPAASATSPPTGASPTCSAQFHGLAARDF